MPNEKRPPARNSVEEKIEEMYQRMQEPGYGEAMIKAFRTPPRVRLEFPPAEIDLNEGEDLLSEE